MSRQWVNSIQWNTPIQSYLIEWCDFMNFINGIITVKGDIFSKTTRNEIDEINVTSAEGKRTSEINESNWMEWIDLSFWFISLPL